MRPSSATAPSTGAARVELCIANSVQELPRATAALDSLAAGYPLPDDVVVDMKVALDEVLANLIRYAFEDQAQHRIELVLSAAQGALEAVVRDDGVAFDPLSAPAPDLDAPLEDRPLGGLGIHLVRSLMSEVEYRRLEGRNVLRIVRRFP